MAMRCCKRSRDSTSETSRLLDETLVSDDEASDPEERLATEEPDIEPWRLAGCADGDKRKAAEEPRLGCADIFADPDIRDEANKKAMSQLSGKCGHIYGLNWLGPVVDCERHLVEALAFNISMHLVLGVAGYYGTSCDNGSTYPRPLLWTVLIIFVGFVLSREYRCFWRISIPLIQSISSFKVFGMPLGFFPWLVFQVTLTVSFHYSTAGLTVTIVESFSMAACGRFAAVDDMWAEVMKRSLFLNGWFIHWRALIIAVWLGTMLRIVVTIVFWWPFPKPVSDKVELLNLYGAPIRPVECFYRVTSSLGLSALSSHVHQFRQMRFFDNTMIIASTSDPQKRVKEWAYALGDVTALVNHITYKLMWFHMFETVSLSMQVTLFAAQSQTNPESSARLHELVIGVGICLGLLTLYNVIMVEVFWLCSVRPSAERHDFANDDGTPRPRGYSDIEGQDTRFAMLVFRAVWTGFTAVFLLVVLQLGVGWLVCPQHFWNLNWHLREGCVDLAPLKQHISKRDPSIWTYAVLNGCLLLAGAFAAACCVHLLLVLGWILRDRVSVVPCPCQVPSSDSEGDHDAEE